MSPDQWLITAVLLLALVLFVHGKLRHDLVALLALVGVVAGGLVPAEQAFLGFAHPATVTVGLVLVAGRGLTASGAVDRLAHLLRPSTGGVPSHVASLSGIGALMSAFMNNVGALALLMPVAVDSSEKAKRSPALVLMPLSFATILGGMLTLVGTPPNLIVSGIRQEATGAPFELFDFTPVGLAVAGVGVLFVATVGWRLLPRSSRDRVATAELRSLDEYLAELRVPAESEWIGRPGLELAELASEHEVTLVGLVRKPRRYWASATAQDLRKGDLLIVEAAPKALDAFVRKSRLELTGAAQEAGESLQGGDAAVAEMVIPASSRAVGRTTRQLNLRRLHGVTLLGLSRQGRPRRERLRDISLRSGDVLLLHGDRDRLEEARSAQGLLALEDRKLRVGTPGRAGLALGLFAAAIGISALGWAPLSLGLLAAVLAMLISGLLPLRDLYTAVDWPVIVLLGAMLPVGGALESTGLAGRLAEIVASNGAQLPAWVLVALLMVVTMTLSDLMNNAATAVVMAPIALGLAERLSLSADPLLMAVAVGASCAFLTPIGHQNNTLVMGPGGYGFGDYWRMGLPLQLLIFVVGVPAILLVWPA